MFVSMKGVGHDGRALHLHWNLIAVSNHGPHIPCGAAVALTRKLVRGDKLPTGAMPCLGLLTLADYIAALDGLVILDVCKSLVLAWRSSIHHARRRLWAYGI